MSMKVERDDFLQDADVYDDRWIARTVHVSGVTGR